VTVLGPRSARRRPRSRIQRRVVAALVLALVFAVGIALGQALDDNPAPGGTTTYDRTLTVFPEQQTVTVTAP
jgi:hypothetical protein